MAEIRQRTTITVQLVGKATDKTWRRRLIAEGLAVPTSRSCHVAVVDLRGTDDVNAGLLAAENAAGITPLVAITGLSQPLPAARHGVTIVRLDEDRPRPLVRAIRAAGQGRILALAASVRLRAGAAHGRLLQAGEVEGAGAPAVLLSEPGPRILPMLAGLKSTEIAAPLSSSHALRLLESRQATSLVIHIDAAREHRVPVLKLIRRQTDLDGLPVAVLCDRWDSELAGSWLTAGADLIGHPDELRAVLGILREAAGRYTTQSAMKLALASAATTDAGEPSPIHGQAAFARLAAEHHARGESVVYGAIELETEAHGTGQDIAEAGVYMAMALSPVDFICRPRHDLFLVAMPYADRFFGGRTMRTLQTLIEDLKFGQEPSPVLISARTAAIEADGFSGDVLARLDTELARKKADALLLA